MVKVVLAKQDLVWTLFGSIFAKELTVLSNRLVLGTARGRSREIKDAN